MLAKKTTSGGHSFYDNLETNGKRSKTVSFGNNPVEEKHLNELNKKIQNWFYSEKNIEEAKNALFLIISKDSKYSDSMSASEFFNSLSDEEFKEISESQSESKIFTSLVEMTSSVDLTYNTGNSQFKVHGTDSNTLTDNVNSSINDNNSPLHSILISTKFAELNTTVSQKNLEERLVDAQLMKFKEDDTISSNIRVTINKSNKGTFIDLEDIYGQNCFSVESMINEIHKFLGKPDSFFVRPTSTCDGHENVLYYFKKEGKQFFYVVIPMPPTFDYFVEGVEKSENTNKYITLYSTDSLDEIVGEGQLFPMLKTYSLELERIKDKKDSSSSYGSSYYKSSTAELENKLLDNALSSIKNITITEDEANETISPNNVKYFLNDYLEENNKSEIILVEPKTGKKILVWKKEDLSNHPFFTFIK